VSFKSRNQDKGEVEEGEEKYDEDEEDMMDEI
jgi:hypothetical protein